jgi:hypothetical protein
MHPTTPTRAGRLADASVDPTYARNDILGCFGRSDRSRLRLSDGVPAVSARFFRLEDESRLPGAVTIGIRGGHARRLGRGRRPDLTGDRGRGGAPLPATPPRCRRDPRPPPSPRRRTRRTPRGRVDPLGASLGRRGRRLRLAVPCGEVAHRADGIAGRRPLPAQRQVGPRVRRVAEGGRRDTEYTDDRQGAADRVPASPPRFVSGRGNEMDRRRPA